jgi:hypothetical protein
MQFFFLLLFNVFLGAVLYLVISLKLERSATEFRERRLRKEMDEIIKEFNLTAERNISILESRIRAIRNLLAQSGEIKSLDVTLAEEETSPPRLEHAADTPVLSVPGRGADDAGNYQAGGGRRGAENNVAELIKKGLILFFRKMITILPVRSMDHAAGDTLAGDNGGGEDPESSPVFPMRAGSQERANILIEKDLSAAMHAGEAAAWKKEAITEEEISEIIRSSEDKYSMVSVLFERGCDIEDISRYSGIPSGEVRLVLNISRETSGNSL